MSGDAAPRLFRLPDTKHPLRGLPPREKRPEKPPKRASRHYYTLYSKVTLRLLPQVHSGQQLGTLLVRLDIHGNLGCLDPFHRVLDHHVHQVDPHRVVGMGAGTDGALGPGRSQ